MEGKGFTMSGRIKKKDGMMSILAHTKNLPGQDQEQCDLSPELALTLCLLHFEREVGPETSKGPF